MSTYIFYCGIAFMIGAFTAAIIIPLIVAFCRKVGFYDHPNQRKVHHAAIPRLGGLSFLPAMAIGSSIAMLLFYSNTLTAPDFHVTAALMIAGASMIYIVGIMDDIMDLPANMKFVIMAVGATVLPVCNLIFDDVHGFLGFHTLPLWVAYPLTVLIIMTVVNAINLIDGIDGLASGISIIILAVYVYLFIDLGSIVFVVITASLLGAVIVFFCYNVFGRVGGMKIFMGDAGSLVLGYVLAYLGIKFVMISGQEDYNVINPLLIPFSLLIVPVFDLIRVALLRLAAGEPIFHADQRHIHHMLMRCGLNMHQTLIVILLMVVGFLILNLVLDSVLVPMTVIFFFDVAFFLLFYVVCTSIIQIRDSSLADS